MGKSITDLSSVTTVGLDLAKHVFQVHGVDASGRVVVAKAIRRNKLLEFFASLPPCLVGLEASGSAHHWARELIKLGHDARIMPPAYVKPYIRRQKNDAADAAAICEAVTRPSMRFVGVRSLENQAALMRHKAREMLVSQRTQLLNGLRGHLTEVGVIAPQGLRFARELAELIEACDETIPFEVCEALAPLVVQLRNLDEAIALMQAHPNANATSIFTSSGKAAREFARHATASMVGVNIGVAAPMAYFPFGGAKDSFFGDLKVHGRDAFEFYTDKKVTITRWL